MSLTWLAGLIFLKTLLFAPLLTVLWNLDFIHWTLGLVLVPVSLLLGVALMHLAIYAIYCLVPAAQNGRHKVMGSKDSIFWSVENAISNTSLNIFQGVLFMNDTVRYFLLKSLHCDVHHSTFISTRTVVGNPRKFSIGENSLLGEYVHIAPSMQPKLGLLIVQEINVGSDVLIGAYSTLTPGVTIGDHCRIQTDVFFSVNAKLEESVNVGARTVINENVLIGESSKIGKDCIIQAGVKIPKKSIIPNGTNVSSDYFKSSTQSIRSQNFVVVEKATVSPEAQV